MGNQLVFATDNFKVTKVQRITRLNKRDGKPSVLPFCLSLIDHSFQWRNRIFYESKVQYLNQCIYIVKLSYSINLINLMICLCYVSIFNTQYTFNSTDA